MSQRVVIHVGCPKTGTSWIQHQLVANSDLLAELGFSYPADEHGFEQHFAATADLRDVPPQEYGMEEPGAWDRLAAVVNATPGTAIVSHELLAACTPDQVRRAVESFPSASVEVVITARDLARQIPSEWQEHIKHGFTGTLRDFVDGIRDPERPEPFARWFWAVQDLPHVAMRWAAGVGADKVTIVTIPAPGSKGTTLEERFGSAIGLDFSLLQRDEGRRNASMGIAEAELLRRLNERRHGVIAKETYHDLVRERIVQDVLGPQRVSASLRMPTADAAWVDEVTDYWLSEIPRVGYPVVGDLQDLRSTEAVADETFSDDQMIEAATRALVGALDAYDDLRDRLKELRVELGDAPPHSKVEHFKRDVVHRLERSKGGQRVLGVWRKRHQRPPAG